MWEKIKLRSVLLVTRLGWSHWALFVGLCMYSELTIVWSNSVTLQHGLIIASSSTDSVATERSSNTDLVVRLWSAIDCNWTKKSELPYFLSKVAGICTWCNMQNGTAEKSFLPKINDYTLHFVTKKESRSMSLQNEAHCWLAVLPMYYPQIIMFLFLQWS